MGWRRAKVNEKRLLTRFDLCEIGCLDMAEPADLERQTRQLDRDLVICRRQAREDFANDRVVFANQAAFEPPLLAAAENVEGSAAEATQATTDGMIEALIKLTRKAGEKVSAVP